MLVTWILGLQRQTEAISMSHQTHGLGPVMAVGLGFIGLPDTVGGQPGVYSASLRWGRASLSTLWWQAGAEWHRQCEALSLTLFVPL